MQGPLRGRPAISYPRRMVGTHDGLLPGDRVAVAGNEPRLQTATVVREVEPGLWLVVDERTHRRVVVKGEALLVLERSGDRVDGEIRAEMAEILSCEGGQ